MSGDSYRLREVKGAMPIAAEGWRILVLQTGDSS